MQLKHLILVALCVSFVYSTDVVICTATTTGGTSIVKFGQCQMCHPSCLTCTKGTGDANCATCAAGLGVPAGGNAKCACAANDIFTTSTTVLACAATTSTDAACPGALGYFWVSAPKCARANWKFKAPVNETADKCKTGAAGLGCWGNAICSSAGACDYAAGKAYVLGSDKAMTSTSTVPGYFYDSSTHEFKPCALGCKKCTSATVCTECVAPWKPKTDQTTDACECPAEGAWDNSGVCTANITNCKTQTEDKKCDKCDTDYGTPKENDKTGKETDVSKCEKPATTDPATTPATTTIEEDKPAEGCNATAYGCTKCDTTADKKCETCNATKHWVTDGAGGCKCDSKQWVSSTKDKKDCGLQCTAPCATGEVATLDSTATPAKCKCAAGTADTTAAATTSGLLLTVASMVMAVILA